VTQLRKQMLEEIQRRNYSHRTARTYVRIVRDFAEYFHQPPDQLGPEQIRQYHAPSHLIVVAIAIEWTAAARVTEGRIFRAVARMGKVWGKGISQNVVWYEVKTCCERAGLEHIAPHDLRSYAARKTMPSPVAKRAVCADNRAVSRLQAESRTSGKRSF
jgi:hypothetical protein